MTRYTALGLAREGLRGHRGWRPAWRKAQPQAAYDAVVIGGGGHGLATAYYLARMHGVKRVAVLEKGWIGGGNTGRNTTVIRSNYFYPESVALYDLALRLYEGLSKELNYNVMLSQRGMLIAAHTPMQMEICARIANAMKLNGVDGDLMGPEEARARLPLLNHAPDARYHCLGGVWQGRAGIARHDAVAWGYARAASALGVDIIEGITVTGITTQGGRVTGVETDRGAIACDRLGVAAAGATPGLVAPLGVRLPIHDYALQAFVSEPVKPVLDTVLLYLGTGTYVSQSDKGELVFGGGLDRVPTHGQKGNLPVQESIVSGLLEMFPAFGQLKLLRQWGGVVDVVPDSSPILGPVGPEGLFVNCGWGTGGFKAIPAGGWLMAHMLATGDHHEISRPFDLDRFETGRLIDEAAGSGIAH
ncbi:sarcosine oxidase subunit beta family protein [Mameliella alba]|nr:sarcosine oxidase subunit beta family protein [Antarctobacter heliothermus]MBY6145291.1 sarcosine oxidase subunit beta family protein [Mameliella alba]MBY6162101.1 sarcosine oxidase subunit beta family protein [Mameliella alba]MBY6170571.1 sarcosine oxidase subunit beta family protein [Mameliella alba]MBY6175589.1 sarcosine oxidase subunit beta family protein [Mameliella alba]